MRIFLLFSITLVTVYCAPVQNESQSTILSYEYNNDGSGNYNYRYFTSNGILREEQGTLVNKGESDEHIEVHGSYAYLRPDGKRERIEYTADENGYKILESVPMHITGSAPPALVASLLGK